jgi:hypothetical protein
MRKFSEANPEKIVVLGAHSRTSEETTMIRGGM